MKIILVLMINLTIGCSNPDKSSEVKDNSSPVSSIPSKDKLSVSDSLANELSDKTTTITVSYAAIECGCPEWFEAKSKDVKLLEGIERFYLEPISQYLVNANDLWDGEHLPLTLKITGRFSKGKVPPVTYHTKGTSEKARVFWYDKITIVSPPSKQ